MSPEFESIVNQGGRVAGFVNGVLVFSILAAAICGGLLKPGRRAILYVLLSAVCGMLLAEIRFERWWAALLAAERTSADTQWICDHDGGTILVYLRILVGGFISLVAGLVAMVIGAGIRAAWNKLIKRKPGVRTEGYPSRSSS